MTYLSPKPHSLWSKAKQQLERVRRELPRKHKADTVGPVIVQQSYPAPLRSLSSRLLLHLSRYVAIKLILSVIHV